MSPAEYLEQQAAPAIAARVTAWEARAEWLTAVATHGQASPQALDAFEEYDGLDTYATHLEPR